MFKYHIKDAANTIINFDTESTNTWNKDDIIDLQEKSNQYRKAAREQKGLSSTNGKYKRGDIIEFWSGYSDNIRYRAEIAGFIDENIYIIWDCYWSPIRDNKITDIKVV